MPNTQKSPNVRLKPDVNVALEAYIAANPTPPTKQALVDSLLRLALTMKRIPVKGVTVDEAKKSGRTKQ